MGSGGVFFALSDTDLQRLLIVQHGEVLAFVRQMEECGEAEWLLATEKAWDAIHRCLGDGTLQCGGKTLLAKCVLGGRQLYREKDHVVSFLSPDEVRAVSKALEPVSRSVLKGKFFGLKWKFPWFGSPRYAGPIDDRNFALTWKYFEQVRAFYRKAAEANRAMMFAVER